MIRVATWNVNSIRIRLESLRKFVELNRPDILCLQETKVVDEKFPYSDMKSMGFDHIVIRGEKSYNGVAILSKIPFDELKHLSFVNNDTRHIAVRIPNIDIEIHNFYIPAGGDEPDLEVNPKFKHKIDYVRTISNWLQNDKKHQSNLVIVGDLNIAPYEKDVWSHKQLLKVVSHTPIEVESFNKMKSLGKLKDTLRKFVPIEENLFSWWSYRNRDWKKSNRGRRLDHILVSEPLYSKVSNGFIYKETRDYKSPSDHVPVICDFEF